MARVQQGELCVHGRRVSKRRLAVELGLVRPHLRFSIAHEPPPRDERLSSNAPTQASLPDEPVHSVQVRFPLAP